MELKMKELMLMEAITLFLDRLPEREKTVENVYMMAGYGIKTDLESESVLDVMMEDLRNADCTNSAPEIYNNFKIGLSKEDEQQIISNIRALLYPVIVMYESKNPKMNLFGTQVP